MRASKLSRTALGVSLMLVFGTNVFAQDSSLKHFSRDGLAFDYPADWMLRDQSNDQAQHLIIAKPSSSLLIMVWAYREAVRSRLQVMDATQKITEPYIRNLAEKLSDPKTTAKRESACIEVGEATVGGVLVRGVIEEAPAMAEVFAFSKGRRFVNLVYVRANTDDAQGTAGWKLVRDSLRVDTVDPDKAADPDIDLLSGSIYASGVLNGKALKLPAPAYPAVARSVRASGTVPVMVTIDETGKVISARALGGHPSLQKASEESAREARFSPTMLCGKPVKVTGTIIYNFIPR